MNKIVKGVLILLMCLCVCLMGYFIYKDVTGCQYYQQGTVSKIGTCKSGDGFFAGNAGCMTIIKMEYGNLTTGFVYGMVVEGMKVYRGCENGSCSANWNNGSDITNRQWANGRGRCI